MKKFLWMVLPVFAGSMGLAFADQATKDSPAASVVFSDSKKSIMVSPDHPRFSVTLKSNPTTGYRWVIKRYNTHLLRLQGQKYHPANTTRVGAPGYIVFEFSAKKKALIASQETKIVFEYIRPWEASTKDAQRQIFTVVTIPKNS